MLGSLEDAEDLVQETFLRAWRNRASFGSDGRASFRAWLYRIATNACLDVLRGRPRRVVPPEVAAAGNPAPPPAPAVDLPWLRPYPDRLLQGVTPAEDEPGAVVVARETIELAFLAAIQHLPPRQRAVSILRDVLGWSAKDTGHTTPEPDELAGEPLRPETARWVPRNGSQRSDEVTDRQAVPVQQGQHLDHLGALAAPGRVRCRTLTRAEPQAMPGAIYLPQNDGPGPARCQIRPSSKSTAHQRMIRW